MRQWLKEFWKDCPWYALAPLGLELWVARELWPTGKSALLVVLAALAVGLHQSKRWKLLPNPFFHLSLLLAGLLAGLSTMRLASWILSRKWNDMLFADPGYLPLIFTSATLATGVVLALPRLLWLCGLPVPARAFLSPADRAALCIIALIAAIHEVFLELLYRALYPYFLGRGG